MSTPTEVMDTEAVTVEEAELMLVREVEEDVSEVVEVLAEVPKSP